MSDPYEGITTPDPERERLVRSVFRPSSLEEVAEAVSVASEICSSICVEQIGSLYRWSLATWEGGPIPHQRNAAAFLRMDHRSLRGAGCRVIGEGWCVQAINDNAPKPEAWAVLTFDQPVSADEVSARIIDVMGSSQQV